MGGMQKLKRGYKKKCPASFTGLFNQQFMSNHKNKIKTTSIPRPAMQLNNRAKYYYRYAKSGKKKTNKTWSTLSRSFRLLFSVSHVEPLIRQVSTCVSAGLPTKLVAAAAVARSGFPLRFLAETRGNAEPGVVAVFVPRLAGVDGGNPLTVE